MRSIRARLAEWVAFLIRLARLAAAWRWGGLFARAVAAAAGLVVLAAIGRSAVARGSNKAVDSALEPTPFDGGTSSGPSGASASQVHPIELNVLPSASAAPIPPSNPPPPQPDAGAPSGDVTPRNRATPDDPVYLNQASVADLRRLPGVGAKRAQAILALRDRIQRFRQIEDLLKVKGIGRSSLRKLRPLVRLDLPPPAATDAGAAPD
jgi:competence protein ComEA